MKKLNMKTEWQAFLLSALVLFLNRFFDLGLTEGDIITLFSGSAAYGLSRGMAKKGQKNADPH